ncbi:kinase [Hirsutella rhossiliensis]|uniref:EKC/KEOPS complex subunit BUD32 n=1 Tax=Hirsutella rhossiliensis TaxID=111463 RepID=A0A9P8MLM6_9HYPO|nr:kinase [Hirsutella rhossiliensis]KAH0957247.1 kinase [Hirsutella rhossiliensis]
MGQETALDLHSPLNNRNVASELATILGHLRQGHYDYGHFFPLVKLVTQKASDAKIWNAVLDLVAALTRVTPPASVPATFDSTPITHSSASQQGTEQTREVVERKVFEEIRFCTYRDVEGFFEKYFEGKTWTSRALGIYEAIKDQHVDGAWTGLPNPPVQDGVLDWWFRFQDDFLSEERRRYYSTTNPKDLVDAAHDWRDVEVIGELKASNNNKKATLLQIGRYVRDVFSCQPTRRPGAFDIHDKPKRFIQVIAGYAMMNDEELGLDTFTELDGNSRLIHVDQDGTSGRKRLRLESQPFTRQRAVVCRGTSCYLTKPPDFEDWSYVVKFSWTSDRRKPEADLLRLARQRGVEGIADLIGHRRITSINEMRSGLIFTKPYTFRGAPSSAELPGLSIADRPLRKRKSADVSLKPSKRSRSNSQKSSQKQNEVTYDVEGAQGTSLLAPNSGPYDNRVFRCLVISPAGRAIHKYETKSELLGALCDAIKAHRFLHLKGNILHRDISENNIIITDRKTTGHMGMLIDLDLAKELGSGRSGARCRTGTMEFMAVEVLQGISHTYRHDLESFFYVLLWLCGRRGSYREIASAKRGHMHVDGFEDILEEFPQPKFDWDGLFVGTPKDPEILYGPIIKAFDKAIDEIKAMEG